MKSSIPIYEEMWCVETNCGNSKYTTIKYFDSHDMAENYAIVMSLHKGVKSIKVRQLPRNRDY